jgi:hypothetical protein
MITHLAEVPFPEAGVAIVALLRRPGGAIGFSPGETCPGRRLCAVHAVVVGDAAGLGARPPLGWP